ncbi:MAG: ABC transporter ATP-binding protein [Anaerolineaceae bacterium]|nr:ABC transporter ATP-binding protein [Anaerolineaceae bacterium]
MILQVTGVSKRFGGLQALSNVSFNLEEGRIMGLIGPNGAGKTTLFNCINGVYAPEEGRVVFRGENITGQKTYRVAKMGLARTHQIVRPLNDLTIRENVIVGACFGRENHSLNSAEKIADEVLEFVRLKERADQLAGSLNVGQKKRLEMARALAARPYLLLLDEVLAGLNASEISQMVGIVREIRERGTTIIMIEHVMQAVMNVSDDILVLDFGKQIAFGTPEEVANDPVVIEAYLGDPSLAAELSGKKDSA